ncbi:phage tail protein I [Salmonella enterica subsp. salamae]|nr:phage tail protein I [Salmonella enterica subsp. salamae]ECJ2281383.1 phage tail protein I [Salmonella enterica subsp. salamae]
MTFQTLLPANATDGERALEEVISHVGDEPIDIRTVKNPDTCPSELLPWLAWEYAVTYWDEEWNEEQQRSAIRNAAAVNKSRGTPGAVKQALAAIDQTIDIIEWFNDFPEAAPYTFRAVVHGNSITEDELQKISSQITDTKNARSYLTGIQIANQVVSGAFYSGGAYLVRQSITLKASHE